MAKSLVSCAHCQASFECENGAAKRARKRNAPLYCGKKCSGLGRRKYHSKAERVEAKRIYDAEYRMRDPEARKAAKAAYFQATYDPVKAAIERKKRAPQHAEYCRRPEYRQYKSAYDAKRRASVYGEFAESFMTLLTLEREVLTRMTRYEINLANGTLGKAQKRRRDHVDPYRRKSQGSPLGYAQPDQAGQDAGKPG